MPYRDRWRRLRILVPLMLLVTILMRLVWMQLREYRQALDPRVAISLTFVEDHLTREARLCFARPVPEEHPPLTLEGTRAYLASPGYASLAWLACLAERLELKQLAKLNQWLFLATTLAAAVMARFITSSWTIGLIVGGMLLSRGRLLAELGEVRIDAFLMLLVTGWFAGAFHYLRTGSLGCLIALALVTVTGGLFDRSLLGLALVFPAVLLGGLAFRRQLARPLLQRLRTLNRKMREVFPLRALPSTEEEGIFSRFMQSIRWTLGLEFPDRPSASAWRPTYARGGLVRSLSVPFTLWIYTRRRWIKLVAFFALVFAVGAVISALFSAYFLELAMGDAVWRLFEGDGSFELSTWRQAWLASIMAPFDLHLTVSLVVVAVCAMQSPADGLTGFFEAAWLVLVGSVLLALAAGLADLTDSRLITALASDGIFDPQISRLGMRHVFVWLEPVILAMGVAGVYNLMKVLDTRMTQKP